MRRVFSVILAATACMASGTTPWQSQWVWEDAEGRLAYRADEAGDRIPDFSRVGYRGGDEALPLAREAVRVNAREGDCTEAIQAALDAVAKRPRGADGLRGAVVLGAGTFHVSRPLTVKASGVVLRGAGLGEAGTRLVSHVGKKACAILLSGSGGVREVPNTRRRIVQPRVPVGSRTVEVEDAAPFKAGAWVILFRPGTDAWIRDLRMDRIPPRTSGKTVQWTAKGYDLRFTRRVERVEGNRIWLDNPVMMALEERYGGGFLALADTEGLIEQVGVEDLEIVSPAKGPLDDEHAWTGVRLAAVRDGWVRRVDGRGLSYALVHVTRTAQRVTVTDCTNRAPASPITGGYRYAFNCDGEQSLFIRCHSEEGRHDFVTGARTPGPNVFTACTAVRSKADIGSHHRWSVGTLYDRIKTDGRLYVQDRGNAGTGHGWAGVTQVLWNCEAQELIVQSPWVSGKNYCFGCLGRKHPGRWGKGRPDGIWEGHQRPGIQPPSLYQAQLSERQRKRRAEAK